MKVVVVNVKKGVLMFQGNVENSVELEEIRSKFSKPEYKIMYNLFDLVDKFGTRELKILSKKGAIVFQGEVTSDNVKELDKKFPQKEFKYVLGGIR